MKEEELKEKNERKKERKKKKNERKKELNVIFFYQLFGKSSFKYKRKRHFCQKREPSFGKEFENLLN